MRTLAVLLPVLLCGCARALSPTTGSFDWLAGCWQLERGDAVYQEMWLPVGADGTVGAAREVRGGRTVSYEFQRIVLSPEGSLSFIAQPLHQEATEFRMVTHGDGGLVFENPAHDFPQRIEYRLVDLNAMHARVSGTVAGRQRAVEYPMERIPCEG